MTHAELRPEATIEELRAMVGTETGVSSWQVIDQDRIDAYAKVTGDFQFIHVDPERAAATPFGGTIAHGLLTLSLMPVMGLEAQPRIAGMEMGVNYGFNRVRFLTPVKCGDRVRGRFVLSDARQMKPGEIDLRWDVAVEIDGADRPALVAEWLNRFYLDTRSLPAT